MPNQRALAKELGLTQATVSMALRNDPAISPATRKKVREGAERMGYRPNAYVSSLMARIRSGRPLPERGCIAVLCDAGSEQEWMTSETNQEHFNGIAAKAASLGFQIETFYLRSKKLASSRIERMLYARGINGLILPSAGPHASDDIALAWSRYSSAAIAYDWRLPGIDRVATHHRHNVEMTFQRLRTMGYKRIGMCLPPEGWSGVDSNWRAGFYLAQDEVPKSARFPAFVGKPGLTPVSTFERWLKKWKPDAIVGLIGHEMEYLDALKIKVPDDLGLACVNRPMNSHFSGVDENHRLVGETVAELVISGILRNDYGPSDHSKLILVEGKWVEGKTLRVQ